MTFLSNNYDLITRVIPNKFIDDISSKVDENTLLEILIYEISLGITKENGYDEDIDQTYSLTNNGKAVNWRILGLSDDGRLMLTTGSPIQSTYNSSEALSNSNNPYLLLYGAESYEYGPEELNKICAIYKNDLADYIKYLNNASYKNATAAYYENYKLNVNKLDLNNIKIDKNNYGIGIKLYIYKNHKYQILTIPNDVNKKTMNYITTFLNEKFLSYINSFREISILNGDKNLTTLLKYVSQKDTKALIKYLKKHYDDEYNNDYIELIYGTQDNYITPYKYTIKDVEAFEKFLNTYKDLCYNDGKCQKEWCYVNINIDYQSRVPIYEQIVKGVEKLVVLNILKPNEQIPSIRELACTLGINPNTVKKAYDILDSKGIIITKSTKGTFITDDIINAKNDRIKEIFDSLNNNILELKNYGFTIEEIIKKIKK